MSVDISTNTLHIMALLLITYISVNMVNIIDVNKYILEKHNECFTGAQICKVKLKRFFTWAGKSELVSHLNT
ncbi:hypothetical protein METP1_02694 [Methanosarcinales archaeon]|nr:hypothetical protein METP1_02694 [Methanosarcinales archaeon]